MKDIGRAIRRRRRAAGITQGELAERAGLSRVYVVTLETRPRRPSFDVVARIARALNVSVAELIR